MNARPTRSLWPFTLIWIAGLVLVAIAVGLLATAHADELADFGQVAPSSAENARAYSAGAEDAIAVWVRLDCTGLAAAALSRCEDATRGVLDANPSTLARLVARLSEEAAGGRWVKHSTQPVYVAYLVPTRTVFRRLRWYDESGPQASRFDVLAASWADVRALPACSSFFPAVVSSSGTFTPCAQPNPPFAFYGVPEPVVTP